MIIKNLTSSIQKVLVRYLADNDVCTVYIQPYKSIELRDNASIVGDKSTFSGKLLIEGNSPLPTEEEVEFNLPEDTILLEPEEEVGVAESSVEDSKSTDDNPVGDAESTDESIQTSGTTDPSSFICEICGAEFASERGLNSHKSRSHPDE